MSFILLKKRKLKSIFIVVIIAYLMIGAALYALQERFIFLPSKLEQDFSYEFDNEFEELFLNTEDGATINAIHFKKKSPKGVILYFHGNAGDLSRWGEIVQYHVNLQYDLLIIDYRSYGKSKGKLSEKALYDDAQMCYEYLKDKYNESFITVYGRSLGTGLASYIATINKPKQLILETPYYSLTDVAKRRFPFLPVQKLMSYEMPNYKFFDSINCPIYIFHGTADQVIPISSAEKLYDHNKINTKIEFTKIKKGGHNNLIEFDEYRSKIEEILR